MSPHSPHRVGATIWTQHYSAEVTYVQSNKYYRSCIVTHAKWKSKEHWLSNLSVVYTIRNLFFFFGSEKYADVIYWSVVGKGKDIENIVKSIKRNNPKTMLNNKLPIRKSLKSVAWCVYLIQSIYYPMDWGNVTPLHSLQYICKVFV